MEAGRSHRSERGVRMYRIYVYAICKNEEAFAARWAESMAEADGIYVLDTGSTDRTVEILEQNGVHVTKARVEPWRFDAARNRSLRLVPEDADLCVCTDLDEVFHPGWRTAMEQALHGGAKRLRYRYTWSFLPDGREGCVFWTEKAHARFGFRWVHPVHEVLEYEGGCCGSAEAVGVQLDHHPDLQKSRGQYLPLLELAVREHPEDDRNMHYLGREYMFCGRWQECEQTLLRHLALPSAVWREERCASMRFLSRAAEALGKPQEAEQWLLRACGEAPWLREPWLEASMLAAGRGAWSGSLFFAENALRITERGQSYINEPESWGARPYDLAALAAYRMGLFALAQKYGKLAVEQEPDDARLRENLRFYACAASESCNGG